MNTEFSMTHRLSLGNMHINLSGYIDEDATNQLLSLIKDAYVESGKIFIDTRSVNGLSAVASRNFKYSFNSLTIPNKNLYIKGKQGIELIPDGGRLIMFNEKKESDHKNHKEHSCSGTGGCNCKIPCKVCKCAEKKERKIRTSSGLTLQ